MRRVLTKELVSEIARSFSTIKEFQCADESAYKAALRRGWLEEVCAHMIRHYRDTFDKETVASLASKFRKRSDFARSDSSAYSAARKNGWLDDVCCHMGRPINDEWNKFEISGIAKKFSSRSEFARCQNGAYQAANARGWLDEVCEHMEKVHRKKLDKSDVVFIANKFRTRHEFKMADNSAYNVARRNGWLDEVCGHMVRGSYGFNPDRPGYLYQIRFILPSGTCIWKIGITNGSIKVRLRHMGVPSWILYSVDKVVHYTCGREAQKEERRLHADGKYRGLCYDGDPFLVSGNTELFLEPLLKLEG
jgi:hypothetical protein